ncbi:MULTISPECIES: carboxypeptidase regulatory-like domain-containing protein [unclassified Nocardioides]|uniref:carboxypeptidase regulatory-like domain-containing protein n=1 Tax=unclassified Nocardioides TaxID=2615069 RepID=UPI0006FE2EA7|nr:MULTISPECIES: carboxypeptidase regulatory-like domain-containing protein [unclassified Nocardioides]KRA31134.1 hypothetical protein ASD81_16780 [Nocardioides sp. Root614]KRA87754.1 hypothetical protein ASD84_17050 [Nocardioides sp. Root682]
MNRLLGTLLALTLTSLLTLVGPASTATSVDPIPSDAVLSGTVTSSVDGSPLAGVRVALYGADTLFGSGTTTDANGHYSFDVGFARGYRLIFTSPETITHWYGGGETQDSATILDIGATGTTDASTTLKPAGTIRGTYTGTKPLRVVTMAAPYGPIGTSATIGDGQFVARITTEAPIAVGLHWIGVMRFNGNKYHGKNSPAIQVSSGSEVSDIAIDMPATATVTGRTTNMNGGSIHAKVRATVVEDGERLDLVWSTAESDWTTGEYSLVVPATTVTLHAFTSWDLYGTGWLGNAPNATGAAVLEPTEGQTLAGNVISVPGGRTLTGVVRDTAGTPLPGVTVTAFASWTADVKGSAVTNADGNWSITGLGYTSMPDVKVRYTHDRLVTSWFPSVTNEGLGRPALDYLADRGLTVAEQTVTHRSEYRLAATGQPVITGKALTGLTVQTQPVPVTPTPDATRFEWLCNGSLLDITGPSVVLPVSAAGCQLTARQVSMLAGHQPAIVDSAPVPVSAQVATVRAAISGILVDGAVVSATKPVWNFTPDRISHQWYRNGVPIAGATASTYRLVTADVADRISVKVTARDAATGLTGSSLSLSSRYIKARTVLLARAVSNAQHISALLRMRVITPGLTSSSGAISIKYYDHFYYGLINRSLILKTIYGNRQGWVTARITYGGSSLATRASILVRIYFD